MKLKHSQVRVYRREQLANQNNCCALCGEPIVDDAVLDHDHRSGLLRKVLHRGCNTLLGNIENNMKRSLVDINRLTNIAHNLVNYITTQHTDILHPTYKTAEEKAAKAKIRYKKRRLKNANTQSNGS